jgi:hypothetical protein
MPVPKEVLDKWDREDEAKEKERIARRKKQILEENQSVEHQLKTWPKEFEATRIGLKKFEYRLDDRDYQVGDVLTLKEYDPEQAQTWKGLDEARGYSGREISASVTYVLKGPAFGVPEGYAVMSIRRIQ